MPDRGRSRARTRYRIVPIEPAAHRFEITIEIDDPAPDGQLIEFAAWIPGSYLIRDFARHVVQIKAWSADGPLALRQVDKQGWRAAPCSDRLSVRLMVHAWDLSVRGAHLDQSHGFFNATSVFPRVDGRDQEPLDVELVSPRDPACQDWQVATTLPSRGAPPWGFGRYRASCYDELIDHPVEMGRFRRIEFTAHGVPHDVVITGVHDVDPQRLAKDLKAVCERQIALFEPRTRRAPFDRYLFMIMAVGEGYGGLEHRSSTALLCSRADLPYPNMGRQTPGYQTFLGLASHEYFHSWLVKRIKPAAFCPYDLSRENHTRLLWIFEGFTSYYDDLMLVRSGVFDVQAYLVALARSWSQVLRTPGRSVQSVSQSSFEAWTKYYRPDENSPNSGVSYYAKGALIAACLDLTIRLRSDGAHSLDDVMRRLWRRFGLGHETQGLPEDGLPQIVREATGLDLRRQIAAWTDSTAELPLARLLAQIGVETTMGPANEARSSLGVRVVQRGPELFVTTVLDDGPARAVAIAPGDQLIAINGIRMDESRLRQLLARMRPGETVTVHLFRRDELRTTHVTLAAPALTEVSLALKPDTATARLRTKWLGLRSRLP